MGLFLSKFLAFRIQFVFFCIVLQHDLPKILAFCNKSTLIRQDFSFCHGYKKRTIWGFIAFPLILYKTNLSNDNFLMVVNGFMEKLCFIHDIAGCTKKERKEARLLYI